MPTHMRATVLVYSRLGVLLHARLSRILTYRLSPLVMRRCHTHVINALCGLAQNVHIFRLRPAATLGDWHREFLRRLRRVPEIGSSFIRGDHDAYSSPTESPRGCL